MENYRLILALKENVDPSEILPNQVMGSSPNFYRLYDPQDHIAEFKDRSDNIAAPYASDEELFTKEIYPSMIDSEKKLYRTYAVNLNSNEELQQLKNYLEQQEGVEFVQKDELNELYHHPNDPLLSRQWAVQKINCEQAWDISKGDDIIVAVVDTGVDYNHPDISANMWKNAQGKFGYDFSDQDDDPKDYQGHGTHCAGTIAAVMDNSLLVAGIAPKAKIMAVKIFPNAYDSVCVRAIKYAADNGARIISNSWGPVGRKPSNPSVEDAIDYAYNKGCIVVFAAGNSNDDVRFYSPANYSKVISVAATDINDNRADFSNYGNTITVAAPGVDIVSLRMNSSDAVSMSGTSMACPHVSALAALILMKNRQYTFEKVRHFIQAYGDPVTTDRPVGGRINAFASVQNSLNVPKITGARMVFNLTSDDKDKEEEIQLTVTQSGQVIGEGRFGKGIKWSDPGTYPCTVNIAPTDPSLLSSMKIRMYKTPHGSDTGCGMEGSIACDLILEGDLIQKWFTVPVRRYGDNNPYDVTFSQINLITNEL
ncbi:subtilisin family serine protease [Chryseobacterium defluvii]|uniref:Subtilisin family serine protease n=1 Tax=Chryseobacterium defluvii TaxID=160396 RepID=A0A840K687_9FLAO|nr:S8 family serine peptidase [Chryseobacterium defluvii]MBB4804736.1 subtilisin family serine protease [Chryseobacterium defluvii]